MNEKNNEIQKDNKEQDQIIVLHGQMLKRVNFLQSQKLSLISTIPSLLVIISFGYTYLASLQQELQLSIKIVAVIIVYVLSFGASIHNLNSIFTEKKELVILEYFRQEISHFKNHIERYPGLYGTSLKSRKKEQRLYYKRARTYLSALYSFIGGFSIIPMILESGNNTLKEILIPVMIIIGAVLIFFSSFYSFFHLIYKSASELAIREKKK